MLLQYLEIPLWLPTSWVRASPVVRIQEKILIKKLSQFSNNWTTPNALVFRRWRCGVREATFGVDVCRRLAWESTSASSAPSSLGGRSVSSSTFEATPERSRLAVKLAGKVSRESRRSNFTRVLLPSTDMMESSFTMFWWKLRKCHVVEAWTVPVRYGSHRSSRSLIKSSRFFAKDFVH